MEEEIEVNFRLDPQGRTITNENAAVTRDIRALDYKATAVLTSIVAVQPAGQEGRSSATLTDPSTLDEILYDCEIADSGLMPRTFWVPAQGFTPRCTLEQMAFDVFNYHVQVLQSTDSSKNTASNSTTFDTISFDPALSGAEWWVQIRPSPDKVGRYSMHCNPRDDEQEEVNIQGQDNNLAKHGISFHWDKDEDLRLLCGGSTYIHPHVSTVTYLTNLGAPTMILNTRVNNLTGEWMPVEETDEECCEVTISWPACGKHLSFDGRYLHAAPVNLLNDGEFEEQTTLPLASNSHELKKLQRRYRRVTFLVNVWLNYKPFNVSPFPESMVDKMSGSNRNETCRLAFQSGSTIRANKKQIVVATETERDKEPSENVTALTWPLGDTGSGESLTVALPLDDIRQEAENGGTVSITWPKAKEGTAYAYQRPFLTRIKKDLPS